MMNKGIAYKGATQQKIDRSWMARGMAAAKREGEKRILKRETSIVEGQKVKDEDSVLNRTIPNYYEASIMMCGPCAMDYCFSPLTIQCRLVKPEGLQYE